MPGRAIPIITGEIYHIYNRGVAKQPTFVNETEYQRMIRLAWFYRFIKPPIRYSKFNKLSKAIQDNFIQNMPNNPKLVEIYAYAFMPNHFHILLKQLVDGGIALFTNKITNGYTKFKNDKLDRVGPVFQGTYKATLMESDEQLLHTHRYILLNPYTSRIVNSFNELQSYRYCSLFECLQPQNAYICDTQQILTHFNNLDSYLTFLQNNLAYQRLLKK